MATQRKLILDDVSLVLATVETARHQLPGHDEDDIIALIEEGDLLYAWNIGLGGSREVRIFPDCLTHYRTSPGKAWKFPKTETQVIADLLGVNVEKPFIRSSTLRLILNCSSTHIINLVQSQSLRVLPNTTWGRGPSGSALITTTSLKQFLVERRLP